MDSYYCQVSARIVSYAVSVPAPLPCELDSSGSASVKLTTLLGKQGLLTSGEEKWTLAFDTDQFFVLLHSPKRNPVFVLKPILATQNQR